ncbi:MAG: pilus assembly protein TadE [Pseudonocardiales bacterium]|nr:MAG: pilus assembly protein TadE [Pseudonocardiales bacterium]
MLARRPREDADAGMVTAEIAAALPALMVLLGAALTAVAVVGGQLACVDAAREAARAAARGEPAVVVQQLGHATAPSGARIVVMPAGADVRVEVWATVHPIGGLLPGFDVSATAVALAEPSGGVP